MVEKNNETAIEIVEENPTPVTVEETEKVKAEEVKTEEVKAEEIEAAEVEEDEETETIDEEPATLKCPNKREFNVKPEKKSKFVDDIDPKLPDTIFARALVSSLSDESNVIVPDIEIYKTLSNIMNLKTLKNKNGIKLSQLSGDFRKLVKYADLPIEDGETDIDFYYKNFCETDEDGKELSPEEIAKRKLAFDIQIDDFFKDGFSIDTNKGKHITLSKNENGEMEITASGKQKFTSECAESMVALSVAAGWRSMEVSGSPRQKDLLWVEIEKRNLKEELEFEKAKALGQIPENEVYKPITCANTDFSPSLKAQKQAKKEKDAMLKEFYSENKDLIKNKQTETQENQEIPKTTATQKPGLK